MKTVIGFVFLSIFVAYANANDVQSRASFQLGDILKPIIECLMDNLAALSKQDLSVILEKLKQILVKLGGCLNINVGGATETDILALLQCLIEKLSQLSGNELSDIVKQLQPVLNKVENILNCIRAVLKKFCNGLCNIPGLTICGSNILGIDLLEVIMQILNPVVQLLFCKVLG